MSIIGVKSEIWKKKEPKDITILKERVRKYSITFNDLYLSWKNCHKMLPATLNYEMQISIDEVSEEKIVSSRKRSSHIDLFNQNVDDAAVKRLV